MHGRVLAHLMHNDLSKLKLASMSTMTIICTMRCCRCMGGCSARLVVLHALVLTTQLQYKERMYGVVRVLTWCVRMSLYEHLD